MLVPGATVPQRLGRFEISSHLATGGMAEIYLARMAGERDPVVVKVITRDHATDDKFIQMFLDEARLVATLNHPNIARLLEVGKDGQVYFLAMEFVRGETVRAVLEKCARARAPIPHGVVLGIAARVAQALHHAHERKGLGGNALEIVHRDVTPSNVMVGNDGVVKLLDFGVARAKGRSQETVSGTVKGKFAYMAPEQCLGKRVDRRADVFSLGILIYEMSTLRRAFRAESDYDTLTKIVQGDIAAPSTLVPDFPPALEALIQKAMSIDLDVRYQSAAEIGVAIEALAAELGGLAGPAELAAFMAERFPASAGVGAGGVDAGGSVPERVEPARSRPVTSPPSVGRVPTGPIPSFSQALVPAPPREQRTTGANALYTPAVTPAAPAAPAAAPPSSAPSAAAAPPSAAGAPAAGAPAAPSYAGAPAAPPADVLAGRTDWAGSERPGDLGGAQQKTMMGHGAPSAAPAPTPVPSPPRLRPPTAPFALNAPVSATPAGMGAVSLPPPPAPDRGLPWALPVALVAIAVVTAAIVAAILLT